VRALREQDTLNFKKLFRSVDVLMVDDDNVLAPDFLEKTLSIAEEHPDLGAWGASIEGEFEIPVPGWLERELLFLAVRPIDRTQIALRPEAGFRTPAGAGMTLRRQVADRYLEMLDRDPLRAELDRKGKSLISSGDTDLSMCAWDNGLGLANFPELKLVHLIPRERMTVAYMARLHEGMAFSAYVFNSLRGEDARQTIPTANRMFRTFARELLHGRLVGIRLFLAQIRGARRAHQSFVQDWKTKSSTQG